MRARLADDEAGNWLLAARDDPGEDSPIYQLVEGPFMSSMMREPDKANGVPNIAHGGYFILVDGNLHLRGTYDSNDIQRLDELIRDARYLARKGS